MLTEPTLEKLRAMRLTAMAESYVEQQNKPEMRELVFDERLGLLVDAEYLARENRKLATLLREAKFKIAQACVEDIDYPARRELDKTLVRQLATCRWVQEHQNVLVTGATGTGKSYIVAAHDLPAENGPGREFPFRSGPGVGGAGTGMGIRRCS